MSDDELYTNPHPVAGEDGRVGIAFDLDEEELDRRIAVLREATKGDPEYETLVSEIETAHYWRRGGPAGERKRQLERWQRSVTEVQRLLGLKDWKITCQYAEGEALAFMQKEGMVCRVDSEPKQAVISINGEALAKYDEDVQWAILAHECLHVWHSPDQKHTPLTYFPFEERLVQCIARALHCLRTDPESVLPVAGNSAEVLVAKVHRLLSLYENRWEIFTAAQSPILVDDERWPAFAWSTYYEDPQGGVAALCPPQIQLRYDPEYIQEMKLSPGHAILAALLHVIFNPYGPPEVNPPQVRGVKQLMRVFVRLGWPPEKLKWHEV